ncbi:MAG: DNA repair protein RecO [endosymbiont of Seepiophila jonesi]|uniref:DNA repair protein RecO n=1 Tax=endosymbiont of Lamellibrachia luymesi TaxID=2200907 RepID=A0A370E1Z4_9GAMM|nr:MAG: DNA repair protein RecO [endosymbiont of Seepiophila jonesi]RDH93045.1 MAG: DNA repair protein RecO [endosymbiont of Lamellibrachia luymesi]
MSALELQPCFVIHRRNYRNSSLLLELFTPQDGRFSAIAKGVKSGRSSRSALLQPFRPLLVGVSGRGEIKTLRQAEAEGKVYTLARKALYCGFYLNELLMRLLERNDPHPTLFLHYINALQALSESPSLEDTLRSFEVSLLRETGYELLLDHEAENGEAVQPDGLYDYHIEQGPIRAVVKADSENHNVIHGSTLISLQQGLQLTSQARREARGLMRRILAFYLGDKPLKSRELFRGPN